MLKVHKGTTIAVVLDIAALLCIFPGYFVAAGILSVLAYLSSIREIAKYTSIYQFITVFASAAIAGLSLDLPVQLPFLSMAVLLAAGGSILRIVFFKTFSYTGYAWFEPVMFVLSLACYIYGNIAGHYGWQGYAIPLPVLVFAGILGWGIVKDKQQLLARSKGGYHVQIGEPAEAFELPDQDNQLIRLADFKGKRHLLLIFVRGDWCPGCHMMLRTYEKHNSTFQKKNVFVLAIGPDPVGVNKQMVEKLGLDFRVLADEGQKTAMKYGVQMREYDNAFAEKYEAGIPLPASFLVDINGIVRYASRPDKVGEFLNPSSIFPIVEALN